MSEPIIKYTKGNGVNIAFAQWEGKNKTIFCIHGLAASCRCWDHIANNLAPINKILAMDLRGRGLSDKPVTGYSVLDHCRDIEQLFEQQNIKKAVIMGWSLGALISLSFAAQHPKKVDRLILVDGGGKLEKEETQKVIDAIQPTLNRLGKIFPSEKTYFDLMKANPLLGPWTQVLETYYRYELEKVAGGVCSRVKPEHIKEEITNLANFNVSDYYPKIKCPVLILRATEPMIPHNAMLLPDQAVKKMLKKIPDARFINIEGANHYSIVLLLIAAIK